jgi:hypothetical protein
MVYVDKMELSPRFRPQRHMLLMHRLEKIQKETGNYSKLISPSKNYSKSVKSKEKNEEKNESEHAIQTRKNMRLYMEKCKSETSDDNPPPCILFNILINSSNQTSIRPLDYKIDDAEVA